MQLEVHKRDTRTSNPSPLQDALPVRLPGRVYHAFGRVALLDIGRREFTSIRMAVLAEICRFLYLFEAEEPYGIRAVGVMATRAGQLSGLRLCIRPPTKGVPESAPERPCCMRLLGNAGVAP